MDTLQSVTIEVLPDNRLSKNGLRRSNWRTSRQLIAEARETAFILGLAEKPETWETPSEARIAIVQRYARKPLDFDGLACIAAPSVDGLVDAGILMDDDPTHVVEYTLNHVKVPKVTDACVQITVTPVSA